MALRHIYLWRVLPVILEEVKLTPNTWGPSSLKFSLQMLDSEGMGADAKYNWCYIQAVWIGGNEPAGADPAVLSPRSIASACVLQCS